MIGIEITVDKPDLATMLSGLGRQLPFAESVAINNLVDDAQTAIRATLPGTFTLRRADFINRTIYIANADRARKDNLRAVVRVDPSRNFLAKFEAGGEKTSQSGKSLAVPIFREDNKTLIIRAGDPLALAKVMQAIEQRQGKLRGRRRKGEPKPLISQQSQVYLVKSASGTFIAERTGTTTRVLYAFKKEVPIAPELHFVDTARAAVLAHKDQRFEEAIQYAIATMR